MSKKPQIIYLQTKNLKNYVVRYGNQRLTMSVCACLSEKKLGPRMYLYQQNSYKDIKAEIFQNRLSLNH